MVIAKQLFCGLSNEGTQSVKFLDVTLWCAGSSLWNNNFQIVNCWQMRIKLSLPLSYLKIYLVYTRLD